MSSRIRGTAKVAEKVDLIKEVTPFLLELSPLLADPSLKELQEVVAEYTDKLLESLPTLEEQAVYMQDLEKNQEKFAYPGFKRLQAIADAVSLAAGITGRAAGQGPNDPEVDDESGLTDAEVAAIKIYTADDYKYLNPGLEEGRGAWLKWSIHNLAAARMTSAKGDEAKRRKENSLGRSPNPASLALSRRQTRRWRKELSMPKSRSGD